MRVLGIPRQYLAQGKADDILASLGLDGAGIAESVRRAAADVRTVAQRREVRPAALSEVASGRVRSYPGVPTASGCPVLRSMTSLKRTRRPERNTARR